MNQDEIVQVLASHIQWLNSGFCNGQRADLRDANLRGAILRGADLRGADLSDADLSDADLDVNTLSSVLPLICPEKGSFTGFKKAKDNLIVELYIPSKAKRVSSTERKCRCDIAKVISITNLDGSKSDKTKVSSCYAPGFVYEIGKYVSVDNFNDDRRETCAAGIHFFITRQEAVDYQ